MQKGTFHSTRLFRFSGLTGAEVKQALWLHSAGESRSQRADLKRARAGQEANAEPLTRSEVPPSRLQCHYCRQTFHLQANRKSVNLTIGLVPPIPTSRPGRWLRPLRALRRLRGCAFQALSFPATHPCLTFALVCRSQSAIISPQRPAVGVSSSPWFSFLTCMVKCCRTAGAGPVGGFALSLSLYYALPY